MIGAVLMAAAVLLIVSGIGKLRSPEPARRMLASLTSRAPIGGTSVRASHVRLAASAEVAVGGWSLTTGSRWAGLTLAACYAVFAAMSLAMARRPARVACGCFGESDAPVGIAHVAVNVLACAAGLAATLAPPGAFGGLLESSAGTMVQATEIVQICALVICAYVTMTALPVALVARKSVLR